MTFLSNALTSYHVIKRQRRFRNLTAFESKRKEISSSSGQYSLVSLLVAISKTFIILKTPVMIMYLRTLTFVQNPQGKERFCYLINY